ncbi:MAG TPA: hypothetical protein DCL41_04360 [Bdellovibrionales bacterium]|nr:hypothetical protein [Bdellovibrionales bacterium]
MKTSLKAFLLFVGISFVLSGCQTALKSSQKSGEGNFRARALIKDKKKAKSFIVNLNFNIKQEKVIRLDVTSPLNQHLASFLITPKELSYYLVRDKIYYEGKVTARPFSQFMAVPMEPWWLENLLFRKAFTQKDWSCTEDKKGELASCMNLREKINVTWEMDENRKLVVNLNHPKGEVQMNFHHIQPKVEDGAELSQLKIPQGFRRAR